MRYFIIMLILVSMAHALDLRKEIPVIKASAVRNNCNGDDYILLLAIRMSEQGKTGLEFGIMNPKANNLSKQAGWSACTIMAQHKRTGIKRVNKAFIRSLGSRYCPVVGKNLTSDEKKLNKYWVKNVTYWFYKLKGEY